MAERDTADVKVSTDKLFEFVVALVLARNGYKAGVPASRLRGRGSSHQVDVVGLYNVAIPFVLPIRIVAEAKCWAQETVGIEAIRNLYAIVVDLNQSRPPCMVMPSDDEDTACSCHYVGAVFSTTGFSPQAYEFGCSHGVFCVELDGRVAGRTMQSWMEVVIETLRRAVRDPARPPYWLARQGDYNAIATLLTRGITALDGDARSVVVRVIGSLLLNVHDFVDLWEYLRDMRLASIGGNVVVVRIHRGDWSGLLESTVAMVSANVPSVIRTGHIPYDDTRQHRPRVSVVGIEPAPFVDAPTELEALGRQRVLVQLAAGGDSAPLEVDFLLSNPAVHALRQRGQVCFALPLAGDVVLRGRSRWETSP